MACTSMRLLRSHIVVHRDDNLLLKTRDHCRGQDRVTPAHDKRKITRNPGLPESPLQGFSPQTRETVPRPPPHPWPSRRSRTESDPAKIARTSWHPSLLCVEPDQAIGSGFTMGGVYFIDRFPARIPGRDGGGQVGRGNHQLCLGSAAPVSKRKTLRVRLLAELRRATLDDLTSTVEIESRTPPISRSFTTTLGDN